MPSSRDKWFESVGERLRAFVRRRVARAVRNRAEESEAVSDLTQEALAAAAERIDEFRGTTESELIAWVCAIAETKLSDHRRFVRRQKRDAERTRQFGPEGCDAADEEEGPDDALLRSEERAFVRGLIERLPEVERRAIWLRYIEGRPVAEVASHLYRSKAAAQGVLKLGLRHLRSIARTTPVTPPGARDAGARDAEATPPGEGAEG